MPRRGLRNPRTIQSNNTAPTMATIKLHRLNPVTPGWPNNVNAQPPIRDPKIPTIIFEPIPISASVFIMILASQPTIAPNTIHNITFINIHPFLLRFNYYSFQACLILPQCILRSSTRSTNSLREMPFARAYLSVTSSTT